MDISKATCANCGTQMAIVRLKCEECDLTLDGRFEVSSLGQLPPEDQVFVIAFLRHHGSLKKMESLFDISYPTVKNRLYAIAARLDRTFQAPPPNAEVLERLARGEITVDQAIEDLD